MPSLLSAEAVSPSLPPTAVFFLSEFWGNKGWSYLDLSVSQSLLYLKSLLRVYRFSLKLWQF